MSEKELIIILSTKCADLEKQLAEARDLLEEMLDAGYFESSAGLSYIRRIEQLKGEEK